MYKIELKNLNRIITVNSEENLFQALIKNNIPIGSSCSGEKVCGKCWIEIVHSDNSLYMPTDKEKRILEKQKLKDKFRLSCFLKVNSNIIINTSYW